MPASSRPLSLRRFLPTALTAVLLAGPTSPVSAEPTCRPSIDAGTRVVTIDWRDAAACRAAGKAFDGRLEGVRIDEGAGVSITSRHFNFINFAITYTVDETVVESYVLLAKLWEQLFGLGNLTGLLSDSRARVAARAPGAPLTFDDRLVTWLNAILEAERQLNVARSRHASVHLTDAQITAVGVDRRAITDARAQVVAAYERVLPLDDFQDYERYVKVRPAHDALVAKLAAYLALADLTLQGQTKVIARKKGGTIVTVTLTPKDVAGGEAEPVLEIEYFSHSKLPLTFHSGYSYSRLKDFEFEKVRGLQQSDLFALVKADEQTHALSAFLSYELLSTKDNRAGLLGTFGTDFTKPGDRLYLGGSVRWRRIFVTAGRTSATVKEGVNPIVETLGDQLGTRELFGAVAGRRDWATFGAISFAVF